MTGFDRSSQQGLPNIVYVLAFDRVKVESVLSEPGVSGREFLKKIILVPIDIRAVPHAALAVQVTYALDEVLTEAQHDAIIGDRRWPDVLWGIFRPLVRTIRDVRQYVASLGVTLSVVGETVSLVDVLALEAIRVFLLDVFTRIGEQKDAFTALPDNVAPREEKATEKKRQQRGNAIRNARKSASEHW